MHKATLHYLTKDKSGKDLPASDEVGYHLFSEVLCDAMKQAEARHEPWQFGPTVDKRCGARASEGAQKTRMLMAQYLSLAGSSVDCAFSRPWRFQCVLTVAGRDIHFSVSSDAFSTQRTRDVSTNGVYVQFFNETVRAGMCMQVHAIVIRHLGLPSVCTRNNPCESAVEGVSRADFGAAATCNRDWVPLRRQELYRRTALLS